MNENEIIMKHTGLKLRAVQRIKAEDNRRYNDLCVSALVSKIGMSKEYLHELCELGVNQSVIETSIFTKQSLINANSSDNNLLYNISYTQFENIIKMINDDFRNMFSSGMQVECFPINNSSYWNVYVVVTNRYRYEILHSFYAEPFFLASTVPEGFSSSIFKAEILKASRLKEKIIGLLEEKGVSRIIKYRTKKIDYKIEMMVKNTRNYELLSKKISVLCPNGIYSVEEKAKGGVFLTFNEIEIKEPDDRTIKENILFSDFIYKTKNKDLIAQYEWIINCINSRENDEDVFLEDVNCKQREIEIMNEIICLVDNLYIELSKCEDLYFSSLLVDSEFFNLTGIQQSRSFKISHHVLKSFRNGINENGVGTINSSIFVKIGE